MVYYGGNPEYAITSEAEAVEFGLKEGLDFLDNYNDGFIEYSKTIDTKQKAKELFTFCFQEYIKKIPYKPDQTISVEEKILEKIDVEWRDKSLKLPVKLKGFLDRIYREDGKIKIRDYKTCYSFSDPDKIDGGKIIAAIVYYLLVYAKYGEEPYSIVYDEVKYTKNRDGSDQIKSYEMVYSENELYFDFFFRYYEDVIRALNGEMVYLPNVQAMFDNEVAIVSYIHRLDESEEKAKLMKKHKVETISELLKKEIQSAGNMRSLLKTVEEKFVSAKNIDYAKMSMEEKIQTKLMEFGIVLRFDSKISGPTVELYRYTPSIGVKMARIRNFVDDIEQVIGMTGIRVLAPIPGSNLVGFEVPKENREFVSNSYKSKNLILGIGISGEPIEIAIEDMPHLLVAGTTGSGKSVFLNEIIKQTEGKYKLTIIDPKGVDFENGISDHEEIARLFQGFVVEMKKRYETMKKLGVKKWSETGKKSSIILIDEYNDLFLSKEKIVVGNKTQQKLFASGVKELDMPVHDTIGNVIDRCVKLLSQKARAAGIHIILATQRPSVKVLDGDIKANFSTRISFKLPTEIDSKVVLDTAGAEKLLGKGDGLLLKDGNITRFQGFSN